MIRRAASSVAAALLLAACAVKPLPNEQGSPKYGVDITWRGHSCFTLVDSVGRTIVIDPYDETVGYGRLHLRADALLITHSHFDHSNRRAVTARGREIDLVDSSSGTVEHATVASGLVVNGIASSHDPAGGQIDGPNTIYVFQMGGLRCVHLGDLGDPKLTEYQRKAIGHVDVLFIPVGGVTPLGPIEAKRIVDELHPGAVFPMHYGDLRFMRFEPVDRFAALFPPETVRRGGSTVRIRPTDLTDTPIVYILSPQLHN